MHRVLVAVLLLSGCAFGLSGPDPDRPRNQPPRCDTGKGLVVLDGVVAATAGIIAISLAGDTEPAVALLPAAIGGIYLAGAIKGNKAVNECREATSQYEQTTAARETMSPRPAAPPEYDETSDIAERSPLARPAAPPAAPPQLAAPIPSPTAAASRTMQPPAQPPLAAQPPPPVQPAPTAPPPTQAQPPAAQPPPAKAPPGKQPKQPKQAPPPSDDDWSSFWREVE